jgi:hypothetical protein
MKRGLKKGLAIASASVVGLTGLIGVLHMPFGRSLLMKLGGCPIVRISPEQLEQVQNAAVTRGTADATGNAPARPALGFVLEKTTIDEVHAWIDSKGLKCNDDLGDTLIMCPNVPAATVGQQGPDLSSLEFGFRASTKVLRVVSTFRNKMSREQTLALMHDRDGELTRQLGAPKELGHPDLQAPASNAYLVTYNFKDYEAKEQAAEISSGFTLAEHYISQVTPAATAN